MHTPLRGQWNLFKYSVWFDYFLLFWHHFSSFCFCLDVMEFSIPISCFKIMLLLLLLLLTKYYYYFYNNKVALNFNFNLSVLNEYARSYQVTIQNFQVFFVTKVFYLGYEIWCDLLSELFLILIITGVLNACSLDPNCINWTFQKAKSLLVQWT